MAAGAPEKLHYELFPVQGTTDSRYLVLWVRERFFTASTSTPRNTTLSDFMSSENIPKGDAIDCGYGSYILTDTLPKEGSCLRFVFNAPKTTAQVLTPIRDPYFLTEVWDWPDWLKSLYAVKGTVTIEAQTGTYAGQAINTTNSGTRYFDRYVLVKGGQFNTLTRIEEFFSPTPFASTYATEPRPTPVYYNYLGMQNQLNCVHDLITIPELLVSAEQVLDFGMANSPFVTWELGSVFPATNMTGWAEHIRKFDVVERDGGFYGKRRTLTPPPTFNPIQI